MGKPGLAKVGGRLIRLSNLDKVLYPSAGFTKKELIQYYGKIAPAILPHLRGRPITLKRYPDGVDGESFYEKRCPIHRPSWMGTVTLNDIDFCEISDSSGLVWLGNLACIEIHPYLAKRPEVTRPTMMVFDLDPGPPAGIDECREVAFLIRGVLKGMEVFPKTSGGKGLQLFVPLNADVTYGQTKVFARTLAEVLERRHPKLIVSRMKKSLRAGKVLIDWSQNDLNKTTVAPYSLRAREEPAVSAPLTWEELERLPAPDLVFDPMSVLDRVAKLGDLFGPVQVLIQELPPLEMLGRRAA